mmetsp:Transcript_37992/g.81690  ORF Transcript_37992/g.81690 Transcript_37992/m.81690 type:complete len:104 (+) Transcript_37992:455-766(+)
MMSRKDVRTRQELGTARNPRWRKLQLMQQPFEFASPRPMSGGTQHAAWTTAPFFEWQKQPIRQKQVWLPMSCPYPSQQVYHFPIFALFISRFTVTQTVTAERH